jgi:2'-5' RNA ligase
MGSDALVAFLPTDESWCAQDFPHMTLIYAGPVENRPPGDFNAMAKDAISAARTIGPFSLQVTGVEEFGPYGDQVDVLTFYPTPQLLMARKKVESWDTGEFPDYKPHATIGPAGSAAAFFRPNSMDGYRLRALPMTLYFNRIAICWGDRRLIFKLESLGLSNY